jgi:hypothetical protein
MAYKLRVILDVEEDVFRDILVEESQNLEQLHLTIATVFGFNGQEMASFYKTDESWNQGEEIPLFDMSDDGSALCMQNCVLKDVLKVENDKLLYIYDFFSMWTFFIEVKEIQLTTDKELPYTLLSFGEVPEEAPEKNFEADGSFDEIDDFDDLFNQEGLENIDDLDIENF